MKPPCQVGTCRLAAPRGPGAIALRLVEPALIVRLRPFPYELGTSRPVITTRPLGPAGLQLGLAISGSLISRHAAHVLCLAIAARAMHTRTPPPPTAMRLQEPHPGGCPCGVLAGGRAHRDTSGAHSSPMCRIGISHTAITRNHKQGGTTHNAGGRASQGPGHKTSRFAQRHAEGHGLQHCGEWQMRD